MIVIALQVEHEMSHGRQICGELPTIMLLLIHAAGIMHVPNKW